ncbi:hypothetical protein ACFJI1_11165 [Pseudoxanthomonas sp. UC29_72]
MSRSRLLVSTLALALACVSQAHGAELSPVTKQTGLPRTPEQLAVSFEHADLGFKVIPDQRRIEGDATLTFKALSRCRRWWSIWIRNTRSAGSRWTASRWPARPGRTPKAACA